jgi:hypothetical protein
LVGQGLAVLDSIKQGVAASSDAKVTDGARALEK